MQREISALERTGTWALTPLPPDRCRELIILRRSLQLLKW
ncbi:unnamed protein product [Cuscuta europaea]|uniref:Uncharacterized protein n=1 Tax=Cuscuta europaea TaxID=41803 RepID=A0A9P1E5X0_CUSEU|nr:unnamed protein product [Cuscuta europaea]